MKEFAEVLHSWRDRVRPEDAGLPAGPNRRAPGLRRTELAALAGVSVEYIVRLEQGRARHPSPQVLGALARALRLTADERDHLYRVGGVGVPSAGSVSSHVSPGVQRILDRLDDVPMALHTAAWDLVRANPLWTALSGDVSHLRGIERNVAWRHFMSGRGPIDFDDQHAEDFSADLVADLRDAVGRYPHDRSLGTLVARLRAESPDFADRWGEARVARHLSSRKTATTTAAGPITFDCDVLSVPGSDLRMVVYTAAAGSEDASRLALLRVTGAQTAGSS